MGRIKNQLIALREKEALICASIKSLQDKCKHPNVSKTYKSDTGNYDKSQDSYWIEFKCPDCEKYWCQDQ
jgi:hypothetical protein